MLKWFKRFFGASAPAPVPEMDPQEVTQKVDAFLKGLADELASKRSFVRVERVFLDLDHLEEEPQWELHVQAGAYAGACVTYYEDLKAADVSFRGASIYADGFLLIRASRAIIRDEKARERAKEDAAERRKLEQFARVID